MRSRPVGDATGSSFRRPNERPRVGPLLDESSKCPPEPYVGVICVFMDFGEFRQQLVMAGSWKTAHSVDVPGSSYVLLSRRFSNTL
jgi:hypothetical protein